MHSDLVASVGRYRTVLIALSVLIGLFMLAPFAVLVSTSWTTGAFITFPAKGFSLQWYETILNSVDWMMAARLSLVISLSATAIATVVGVAAALALPKVSRPLLAKLLRTLFISPIAIPPVAYAIGLYDVGIRVPALKGSFVVLVVGESLLSMPYVFVLVSGGLSRLDPALRAAASTMGAPWPKIILRVELPMLVGSITAGSLFAFISAFDEVVLAVFLTPIGQQTLPLRMLGASQEAISPELTAASTLVSLLAVLLAGFAWMLSRLASGRARAVRRADAPKTAVKQGG
jgi:putative spermidine/putrescine transport system permease protein